MTFVDFVRIAETTQRRRVVSVARMQNFAGRLYSW